MVHLILPEFQVLYLELVNGVYSLLVRIVHNTDDNHAVHYLYIM